MCKHCKDSHSESEELVVSFSIKHPKSEKVISIERTQSEMEQFAEATARKAIEGDQVAQTGVALLYYLENSAFTKSNQLSVVESRLECTIEALRELKDSAKTVEEFQTSLEAILKGDEAASSLLSIFSSLNND